MATTSARPRAKPAVGNRLPARPLPAPEPPVPPGTPQRVGGPNRRRDRALACLYLFGPGAALSLGAVAVLATVLVLLLGGSSITPPATGAAGLVPGNTLLYVHVSTDPSRPAVRQALAVGRRLPVSPLLYAAVTARLDAMLGGTAGTAISYAADVRPWLGREAALAVLDTTGARAGSLLVLDVRSRVRAERFLSQVGTRPGGAYRGVPLLLGHSGAMLAFVRHYLVLGQPASVQAAIDMAGDRALSLASDPGYRAAASGEPAGRVIDIYASAGGVRRALVPHSGLLGVLGGLLDTPALSAATVSLTPATGGLEIDVHRTLDPRTAAAETSRQFTPNLGAVLPRGSQLLLDASGLRSSLPKLLSLAGALGVAERIPPLLSRLGSALTAQGVDLGQFFGLFSGETVLAVAPGGGGSGPAPVLVTRTSRPGRALTVLGGIEGPLTQVFAPPSSGPGLVPEVSETTLRGVPAHVLSLAPGFRLVYAVARGLIVLSTTPRGVAEVFAHRTALTDARNYQSMPWNHPGRVTSLVFLELSQLLRLGEQAGLIDSARQATLWSVAENIRAVGLASWRGADDTTTQVRLQIP